MTISTGAHDAHAISHADILAMIEANPELRQQVLASLRPPEPANPRKGPIPNEGDITFACASLLDNGPARTGAKGKKGTGPRYKLALEIWTQPLHQISRQAGKANPVFDKNIGLRPKKEFVSLLYKNLRSGKITEEFNEFCLGLTARSAPDFLFGVNIDRNDASSGISEWTWHEQLVVLEMDRDEPVAAVICTSRNTYFHLDQFEGNEGSKYTHTGFLDRVGYFKARDERRE